MKQRREEKDRTEAADALVALACETDDVVYPVNTVTDLKVTDLSIM